MNQLTAFGHLLLHSFRNLLPIVAVVGFFQFAVIREVPPGLLSMAVGLFIVAVGVAVFLQGLELGIFPIGKSLSNQFAKKGSLVLLMAFGFCLGFSAVVAEPALIAVASQAQLISEGRVNGWTLRLLVAVSVGVVVAVGIVRTVLGQSLHGYMIVGYVLVVSVTFFAPAEIVGLAYDSGGVTTSTVTVPIVAALGLGLSSTVPGRNPALDGFGLIAFASVFPIIAVMAYAQVMAWLASRKPQPLDP